jgi:hypothetical protein
MPGKNKNIPMKIGMFLFDQNLGQREALSTLSG